MNPTLEVLAANAAAAPTEAEYRADRDIRALAIAKIRARDAYNALLSSSTEGLTDDELIDREIYLRRLSRAYDAANLAFVRAET